MGLVPMNFGHRDGAVCQSYLWMPFIFRQLPSPYCRTSSALSRMPPPLAMVSTWVILPTSSIFTGDSEIQPMKSPLFHSLHKLRFFQSSSNKRFEAKFFTVEFEATSSPCIPIENGVIFYFKSLDTASIEINCAPKPNEFQFVPLPQKSSS